MSRSFYIVDVFTDRAYAGNPLAVVADATGLTTRRMQQIALEMNYSETTFILPARDRRPPRVRIFTPRTELPFAGHPAIGTAHVIRTELSRRPAMNLTLRLGVGPLSVVCEQRAAGDFYWMRQPPARFGRRVGAGVAAAALGLEPADLVADWPVEEVSTGLAFLIVPVRTRAVLERCRVDPDRSAALLQKLDAAGILAFAPEAAARAHAASVRVFVDALGVPEDPATGSGNGCLAAYLARHRCLGDSRVDVRVEQGWMLGRPSTLYLRATEMDDSVDVRVGGGCVTVARGKLLHA